MKNKESNQNLYRKAMDCALEYTDGIDRRKVYPTDDALKNLVIFDEPLSENPCPEQEILELLHQFGSLATVAQTGGRYFGFVCGSALPAGLAAKTLSTFWDQNSAMNVLSPVTSKLESVTEKWILQSLNLPESFICSFLSGSSLATLCGLAAGRYHLLQKQNWDINKKGLSGAPPLRIITGSHAHSTVIKAISLLGLGSDNIEFVDVDDQGRIRPELIPEIDERTLLILQAGNVCSGAFDDFQSICSRARSAGAWIHIDGAFGLWAGAAKKLSHLTKGMDQAHSLSVDGHKTLNTPYDNGILICSDKIALKSALHMSGSYIVESPERDGMFYTPQMSRRASVIELWAVMKSLGNRGIGEMVERLCDRACQFSKEISAIEGFTVLNDVCFNQVIVACEDDELTEKTMRKVQELRVCWAGGSQWFGRKVIRISISSYKTTEEDITRSVQSFALALKS